MRSNIIHYFIIVFVIVTGIILGSILNNNEARATESCDGTTCQHDLISGFRCFSGVNDDYTCDDSEYPNCVETKCSAEQEEEN